MSQIDVTVNGRSYSIACDDGQEDHLRDLAAYVDKRVQELVATLGQVGDLKLLVMASLLIADELSEAFAAQRGFIGGDVHCNRAKVAEPPRPLVLDCPLRPA